MRCYYEIYKIHVQLYTLSMIRVRNTVNLTGITVSGDFYDLKQLTDAYHSITVSDMEQPDMMSLPYVNISLRVLGRCYYIRHASQGDREIFTEENGIADFHLEYHKMIVPKQNVYFSCNILYPEMLLNMMALNELIQLRIRQLVKLKFQFDAVFDKRVAWDKIISVIRQRKWVYLQKRFINLLVECLMPWIICGLEKSTYVRVLLQHMHFGVN